MPSPKKTVQTEKSERKPKADLSANCNLNDEDVNNDCWNCSRFLFPIGCMVGEDGEGRAESVQS